LREPANAADDGPWALRGVPWRPPGSFPFAVGGPPLRHLG